MAEAVYKLTIAERIRDLLKAAFGDAFRLYRVGDPINPGQSELPAIYITETATQVQLDATGYDALIHTLIIQVVLNKKDEIGKPIEGNTLDTQLDNWTYGRDEQTQEYALMSIMGVLRRNYTLDETTTIQQAVTMRKSLVTRPEEQITAEATIEIEVHELQVVNGRS